MRKQFRSESGWLQDLSHNVVYLLCIVSRIVLFRIFQVTSHEMQTEPKNRAAEIQYVLDIWNNWQNKENKSQMWWMKSFEVIIFGASTMFVMLGWFLGFLRTLVKGLFTFRYCQIYGQWKSFMSRFSNLHAPQSTFFFFLFCFMCRVKPRKWTKSIRLCSDSDSANRLLKRKVWSILRLPATDGHGIVRIQACGLSMTLFWPLFKNLYVPV